MKTENKISQKKINQIIKDNTELINQIAKKYYINPLIDVDKHNKGVLKMMVEFALKYKEKE